MSKELYTELFGCISAYCSSMPSGYGMRFIWFTSRTKAKKTQGFMPCVRFCVNCSGVLSFCRIWRNVILSIGDTSTCPHLDWQGRETPSKTVRSTELSALWCSFRWKAGKGLVSDGWKHVFFVYNYCIGLAVRADIPMGFISNDKNICKLVFWQDRYV